MAVKSSKNTIQTVYKRAPYLVMAQLRAPQLLAARLDLHAQQFFR